MVGVGFVDGVAEPLVALPDDGAVVPCAVEAAVEPPVAVAVVDDDPFTAAPGRPCPRVEDEQPASTTIARPAVTPVRTTPGDVLRCRTTTSAFQRSTETDSRARRATLYA